MIKFTCLAFNQLSLEQLYDIMALRQEVFVVEQNCCYLDADGKDHLSMHMMGYADNGKLAAYARILPKGISYEQYTAIGRVITSSDFRGQGLGKALMENCLNEMETLFYQEPIKISAQTYLIRFYESFGFKTTGDTYLEDDLPHIAMIKD